MHLGSEKYLLLDLFFDSCNLIIKVLETLPPPSWRWYKIVLRRIIEFFLWKKLKGWPHCHHSEIFILWSGSPRMKKKMWWFGNLTHPIDPTAVLPATARISKFTLKFEHSSHLSLPRGRTVQYGRPLKMSRELMMLHERVISPDATFPIDSLDRTIAFKCHFSSWPYSLKSSLLNRHISCVRSSHSLYWILDLLTLKCSSTVIGWRWKVASLLCLGLA